MAESVKDIALRIKHDGVVYGLDAGALVKTSGEQTIDGKKTFKVLPQSAANPVEPTDFATKSYVDSLQGGVAKAYSATVKMKHDTNDYFGFTSFKLNLADGTRLDISQVQNDVDTSTYAKPMAVVFKVVKDLGAKIEVPTKKTAQQIEEYVLQDGEFKGSIEFAKALGDATLSSNRGWYQPWDCYCAHGKYTDLVPIYKVTVTGLKCHLKGVEFEFGDSRSNGYSYTCDGCSIVFAMDGKTVEVPYSGDMANGTKANINIPSELIKEYVDTGTDQNIDGVKTFAKLPKSNATPTDEDDLVTKKYLDEQVNPSTDVSVTITAETSSTENNWCGVSNVQLFLAKDVQLFPLKMEEGTLANLKEPKLMIFTTEKQSSPAPTKVPKQEILDYKLRPGDYRGLFYTADLLGKNTVHSSESWQDPFTKGQGYLTWGDVFNVPEPQIKLVVQNLGQIVAKVGVSESSYAAKNITASSTIRDVTEEGTKTTGTNTNNFAFGDKLSGVFKNAVLTVGDQEINGVKTFALSPKSLSEAVDDTDLVTKGFADANYLAMPVPSTTEIDITCEGSGYAAFSELKILVGEDKVIEPVYLEKRESPPDAKPYRFVYKVSDLGTYQVKQATRKTGAELDKYVLQDGEHWGVLSYSVAFNEQNGMNSYDVQTDPWWGYLFSAREKAKHIMARLHFEDLPLSLKGVQYKSGDKYNSFGYKADKYGAKFTCGKKSQEFELTPAAADHEFLADSGALEPDVTQSFFVELKGNQTVSGVKTFNSVPVTNGYPTAPNNLVTKSYVENNFISNPTSTRTYEALVKVKGNGGNWVGFTYFKTLLADGTRLDLKYIENVSITNATAPAAAVWHVVSDTSSEIKQPETKAKSFIDDYHLQAGEYKGTVSFYKAAGSFTPASSDIYPWACYVGYREEYFGGIYGIKIEALDVPLKGVNFKFGDARPSSSYKYDCEKCVVVFSTALGKVEVEYTGDKSNGTEATIEVPESSGLLGGFATLDTEQTIVGVKSFARPPKCSIVPNDEDDLVNKFFSERRYIINVEPNMELVIGSTANGTSIYEAFSHLNIVLTNGKRLEAKFIEDAINANATPVSVILKTADDPKVQVPVPQRKDKGFMSSYQLLDGEYFAEMTFAEGVGKATTHGTPRQSCPWDSYLAYNLSKGEKTDIVKIVIKDFYAEIESVQFNVGDQYNSYDYVTDKFHFRAKYNGISLAEQTTQEPLSKKLLVKFNLPKGLFAPATETVVKLKKDQSIDGLKTFVKLPQSAATPADEKDLITKKFLDAEIAKLVARIEALESPKP